MALALGVQALLGPQRAITLGCGELPGRLQPGLVLPIQRLPLPGRVLAGLPGLLPGLSGTRASAVIADLSYPEYLNTFGALENILRGNGQWFNPHPWWLTFLPDSAAESLAVEILDQVTNDGVGPFGQVTYYPMTTSAFRTPLLRIPGGSAIFPFNIVRLPSANDQAAIDQMMAQNRTFYERIRSAGGLLYPVAAMAMSKNDWKTHFGSARLYSRLRGVLISLPVSAGDREAPDDRHRYYHRSRPPSSQRSPMPNAWVWQVSWPVTAG